MNIYKFNPDDAKRFGQEQRIKFQTRGDELQFKYCPYCRNRTDDKNTFAINLNTGMFKCLRASCGAHGNMLTLARDFGFSLGRDVDEYYQRKRMFKDIRKYPRPTSHPPAIEYMEGRGISPAVTEKYNIGQHKDGALAFPFYDENDTLQFIKYRNTDPKPGQSKEWCENGCKPILFGMNRCNIENDTLIMTEGQIDSLSVAEAGIENAVSVPTGAKGFTWVPYCWDFLHRFKRLIIFGDCENGHITLLEEMSRRFHGAVLHVREEDYKGCKDANEILKKYGKDAVVEAVKNAVPVNVARIKPMASVVRKDMTQMKMIKSGLSTLDRTIGGFYFGTLIIVTGERGKGKSTLTSQFATYAVHQGVTTFLYSGELMDWMLQDWFERQAAGQENINALKNENGFTTYSVNSDTLEKIKDWYERLAYVYDNALSLDQEDDYEALTDTLEKAIRIYGCKFIVVDNLMTAMEDDVKSDLYRQQTVFVGKLAKMAKRYDAIIILVAHPRKAGVQKFDNDDVAGSANITNLADVVLRYSDAENDDNDPAPPQRSLQVFKNRLTGRLNKNIPLWFEESSKRISEDPGNFDRELGWETQEEWSEPDDDNPFV